MTVRKVLRTHSAWGQILFIFSLEKKKENYYYIWSSTASWKKTLRVRARSLWVVGLEQVRRHSQGSQPATLFEVSENVLRIKGNKTSFCKAGSNIVGCYGSLERVVETGEEIFLWRAHMVAERKCYGPHAVYFETREERKEKRN